MSDVVLSDKTEITFDFYKITLKEWRGLFDKVEDEFASDEKVSRVAGITYQKFVELPYPDYHALMKAFWEKARDPLNDPKNSPSAPTTP